MLSEYDSVSTSTFRSEFENYFKSIRSTSFEQNMKEKLLDSSVEQDDRLDEKMMVEYDEMMDNSKFQENMITREKLPVNTKKEEILNAIATNQVVLISGDTGCGKTTQVRHNLPRFPLQLQINISDVHFRSLNMSWTRISPPGRHPFAKSSVRSLVEFRQSQSLSV